MEEIKGGHVLLFSFAIFLLCFPSLSSSLDYQTHIVNPLSSLSQPMTTPWPEPESKFEAEPGTDPSYIAVELLHIDDLLSSVKSLEQLLKLRRERDALRVETLASVAAGKPTRAQRGFSGPVISGQSQRIGEYPMRLGVGTPPKNFYLTLDTGSDVVWLQCSPCKRCYNQSGPIFDPKNSRSFSTIPCKSPICRRLRFPSCSNSQTCLYKEAYGDGSTTAGDFGTETLTFRGARVERVAFGCGHANQGVFGGEAGLMGLGRGALSFPLQFKNRFNGKFSYCFVDRFSTKSSSLIFGDDAVSRTAVFTPMITNPKVKTLYYVELLGISVGGKRVAGVNASLFKLDSNGNGGVVVDSGTTITLLTQPAYIAFRAAFLSSAKSLKRAPATSNYDTCFDLSGRTKAKVPSVVMHFRGADVSLPRVNVLLPVDNGGTYCFAFHSTMMKLSIIGNHQQQGFRVVYDLVGSRLGFAPRAC